jgi:iron complex outermembrane receptor protein
MLRACRFLLSAAALVAATGAAASAQSAIAGTITDAGTQLPIAGAQVAALGASGVAVATSVSDNDGRYRLNAVPVGTYTVRINRIGYRPVERDGVAVSAGASATLDVQLQETALRLEAVLVSGSRVAQKETDAPTSSHVVEQTLVNERPAATVIDHLAGLAGVDILKGGLIQSNFTVRGFNNIFSGSVLMLTDNRFAFVPSLRVNVPYLMPTNNEDIERIEVVLGPGAALYGPNAANGVMQVFTRSPFDSRGTTATLDVGNQSVLRTAIRHAGAPNDQFGYKLSFEMFRGEDFESIDTNEPIDAGRRLRDFDIEKFGGEARVDFRPIPGAEIIGTYGFARAGSAIEPTGLGAAQVKDWTFNTYQLQGLYGRLYAQVFMNTSDAGETFLLRNRPTASSTAGGVVDKSRQLVFQAQHGWAFGSRQDFIYGLDYQSTEPKTEGTINGRYEDDDDFTEIGGYVHSTTKLSDMFDIVAALRLDKHSRLDDAVWSPRAAVVFKPFDGQAVRVTYNRAFTSPSSNNQFLDLVAGQLPPAPAPALFPVRTLGTPSEGLTFRRNCTGGIGQLCMRSPFAPTAGFIPASATGFYPAALAAASAGNALRNALVAQAGLSTAQADGIVQKLQTSAPPTTVGSVLRVLNPTTRAFTNVAPEFVQDILPIEPTINETFEGGYKGFIGDRLTLNVDLWYQQRENFVTPLLVQTPNVFLDAASIGPYIANTLATGPGALPPAQAAALAPLIAAILGGVPGSSAATGVPLGVVNPDHPFANHSDIILAYRNFGDVDLWGSDFGAEILLTDRITAIGSWSYASKDIIPQAAGQDVTLNAPTQKGMGGLRYRDEGRGFSAEVRARFTHGFPANSGVYVGYVRGYTLWDANFSYKPALLPNAMFSINASNLLDNEHQQFVGAATLGRLIMTRLQYTF